MKLSVKLAGLFGSGVFIITAIPGFFQHIRPTSLSGMANEAVQGMAIMETLFFALLGTGIAAVIGYIIGDILSKPMGNPAPRHQNTRHLQAGSSQTAHSADGPALTGEETFLDDLDQMPEPARVGEALPIETTPIDND